MPLLLLSIVSGAFSSLIAILSTYAIEKLGGATGGAIATLPTTIVPFTIGLAISNDKQSEIDSALWSVAPALLVTALYLCAWRELPWLPFFVPLHNSRPKLTLVILTAVLLAFWLSCAFGLIVLLPYLASIGYSVQFVGSMGLVALLAVGMFSLFFRNFDSPGGKNPVTLLVYLSRGVLAGLVIGGSLLLSSVDPTLAGVLGVAPSITTTVMISMAYSQSYKVSSGAANSMMLGNTSVCVYSILFALFWPSFKISAPEFLALTACVMISFTLASLFIAIPLWMIVRWRKSLLVNANAIKASQLNDTLITQTV